MSFDDTQPFPIGANLGERSCTIPLWLAELAHQEYARHHTQSLHRIGERGGFSRAELVALIRNDFTEEGIRQAKKNVDGLTHG